VRAAGHVGARFIDTAGVGAFRDAIATERSVGLVVLTRLAVTYDLLPLDAIETIVRLAHDRIADDVHKILAVSLQTFGPS
jgi:hypothetical protein